MRTNQQILAQAYLRLAKHIASWAAVVAILAPLAVPSLTNAATSQATARKTAISNSAGGATGVNYDVNFTSAAASTVIKSIRLQFCDAASGPLYNTTCTLPTGMVRGTGISLQTNNTVAFTQSYTAATNGTSDVLLTNATGNTIVSGNAIRLTLTGFTNPTAPNVQYYVRIITCNDTTCTVGTASNFDTGGMALATTQTISVSANVQENLVFCTGISGTTCATLTSSGAAMSLAPNPMSTSSYSTGTSAMIAATNGSGGYTISYVTSNANTGACTGNSGFCDVNSGRIGTDSASNLASVGNLASAEQFGLNLAANTYPSTFGSAGSGATATTYNTANSFSFQSGTTPTTIATVGAPSAQNNYLVSYFANVTASTKPGAYSVNVNYICTATF